MIGLFSLSQVLVQVEDLGKIKEEQVVAELKGKVLPTWQEFKSIFVTIIRSSILGVFVGILPGAGGDIGSWVGYNEAKRWSKNPEKFGTGCIEGVAAPEAANNAVTGGALIPLLTLGIPGSSTTAVLLGGLIIQGLIPGRELFTVHAKITYTVIFGFMLANILMGICGLLASKYIVQVTKIPSAVLGPIIVVLSVVGSYAINNNIFDVYVMAAFGIIGYFMRKTGFHPAPVVLALILGPMAENGLKQSFVLSKGNLLGYFLARPICIVLIILIVLAIASPIILDHFAKKKQKKAQIAEHL